MEIVIFLYVAQLLDLDQVQVYMRVQYYVQMLTLKITGLYLAYFHHIIILVTIELILLSPSQLRR